MRKAFGVGLAVIAIFAGAPAMAAVNFVQNGDFETTTLILSSQITGSTVANWTNANTSGYTGLGYTFLIFPGAADTTGFTSSYGNHDYLWGPGGGPLAGNYSANGMTATSPTGGNYIIQDGDPNFHGALSQSITGLTIGQVYMLSFYSAAAQFGGYSGNTTESWNVSFGSSSADTATVSTPSHGFSPWKQQTMYFVASAVTQTLSFLANGSPSGQPPTNLLDGVSLVAVSEPGALGLFLGGLAIVGGAAWRQGRFRRGVSVGSGLALQQ